MAFDRNRGSFGSSLFESYRRLEDINAGIENSGSIGMPYVSISSPSQQEQDTASYVPWSYSNQDDPCDHNRSPQSNIKMRKLTDSTDFDGETELQGLVSNILDEVDLKDNYYSGGNLPTCNPFWSPKTLREELLQYFQSETKTHHNPSFPPNQETFNKRQQQQLVDINIDQLSQSSGLATNQQWLFNTLNGDFSSCPQKLPPGLPIPKTGNAYQSLTQQGKYVGASVCTERENGQPMNTFLELGDMFRAQSEMNSTSIDAFKDNHINSGKHMCNGQYVPGEFNQLVSSFQSLMTGRDGMFRGDFPTLQKQAVGMQLEDSIAEQWKTTNPAVSTQITPAMQIPNQLVGEFGAVQRERNGALRKQTFKTFQDTPDFSPQNPEYFQQPKTFPSPLNIPDQYQNKMTVYRDNINVSMNRFLKHHNQLSQMQNKIKPQIQKENKRMHVPEYVSEGYPRRHQTNSHLTEGEKHLLSQNPFSDFQGNVQLPKFDGENSMVGPGNIQFMPSMYPVNDPNIPNKPHFNSRAMLGPHYGGSMPGVDLGDQTPASESAAFSSYIGDMRTSRGESTYHGMGSSMTTLMLMKQGGPVIQLYFYLDECHEQWRCLEKERKETQHILTKAFFGKKTAAVTNTNQPKTPPNPTRVEHLIVNLMREQGKVAGLLDRMECLSSLPMHNNIQTALNRHYMAICISQARCKEDITSKHQQQQRPPFTDDKDTLLMVMALKDLAATTRKLRTALWCALQMTLLKTDKMQDHHVHTEDTNRCPSPFKSYSFKL